MTNKVILRTDTIGGSRITETCKVVPAKHHYTAKSRMGGGSVFRRTESAYARIERACDGRRRWEGR